MQIINIRSCKFHEGGSNLGCEGQRAWTQEGGISFSASCISNILTPLTPWVWMQVQEATSVSARGYLSVHTILYLTPFCTSNTIRSSGTSNTLVMSSTNIKWSVLHNAWLFILFGALVTSVRGKLRCPHNLKVWAQAFVSMSTKWHKHGHKTVWVQENIFLVPTTS